MKRFEEIPHTADWSFRAFGRDLRELFENAAFAIFSMQGSIDANAQPSAKEIAREVQVSGIDYESLLVNWLSELLYLQESNRETYQRFRVEEISPNPLETAGSPTALRAIIFGQPARKIDKIIKAVTYHNLKIQKTHDGWEAVVVVDV